MSWRMQLFLFRIRFCKRCRTREGSLGGGKRISRLCWIHRKTQFGVSFKEPVALGELMKAGLL